MADLKPIGSEKLQGQDKIRRIMEIARFNETIPTTINETSKTEFNKTLSDGNNYEIVKERQGYIIKKAISESETDYIEPMKNRKYYSSYSQALKRLNLVAGELNRINENEEGTSMFGEQKRFTLKTPKPKEVVAPVEAAVPPMAPPPVPAPELPASPVGGEEMDFSMDSEEMGPEGDMEMDADVDMEMDGGDDEQVTFKTIQKLTGKLTQKIRTLDTEEGMTSEDIKYVINMVLSSFNLNELSEEDREDILSKFDFIKMEDLDKFGPLQTMLMYNFVNSFFNEEDLKNFRRFAEYNERGLITQNDLTKYKSFEQIISSVSIAEMRVDVKEMENQIIKIREDDEWLLLRPLTYLASKKYGSNTKWCTTQETNSEYFTKYTTKGVLIYCINKVNGYKVASFYSLDKSDPEFSYWNQKDTRIDSTDSELTLELIGFIRDYVKDPKVKTNRYMLSDDMRTKEDVLLKSRTSVALEPIEFNDRPLRTRIGDAIRRENYEENMVQEPQDMDVSEMTEICETETVESIIDSREISPPSFIRNGLISSRACNIFFSNFDIIS
mgnify:CR=1 FL=1